MEKSLRILLSFMTVSPVLREQKHYHHHLYRQTSTRCESICVHLVQLDAMSLDLLQQFARAGRVVVVVKALTLGGRVSQTLTRARLRRRETQRLYRAGYHLTLPSNWENMTSFLMNIYFE